MFIYFAVCKSLIRIVPLSTINVEKICTVETLLDLAITVFKAFISNKALNVRKKVSSVQWADSLLKTLQP